MLKICAVIRRGEAILEVTKVMGQNGLVPNKELREWVQAIFVPLPCEEQLSSPSPCEQVARRTLPDTEASILILDFSASRTVKNQFLWLLNYLVYGILS